MKQENPNREVRESPGFSRGEDVNLEFNSLTAAQHADIIAGLHVDVTKWGTHLRDMVRVASDLSSSHGADVATGMIALAAMGMEDDLTYGAFAAALVAMATTNRTPDAGPSGGWAERVAEPKEQCDRALVRCANLTRERDTAHHERDAAYREVQHLREVTADLQRRADSTRRWLTAQREAEAKPRAYQSRPLTTEEQASADGGECGVWPAWIQPCDPTISTDGDTLWVACTGDDRAASDTPTPIRSVEPGDSWSEIIAEVAAHRCGQEDAS